MIYFLLYEVIINYINIGTFSNIACGLELDKFFSGYIRIEYIFLKYNQKVYKNVSFTQSSKKKKPR